VTEQGESCLNLATLQRSRIGKWLVKMNGGDIEKAADQLYKISCEPNKSGKSFPGKRSAREISNNAAPVIYGKVKTLFEAWEREFGDAEIQPPHTKTPYNQEIDCPHFDGTKPYGYCMETARCLKIVRFMIKRAHLGASLFVSQTLNLGVNHDANGLV